jgi:hypothetical protein
LSITQRLGKKTIYGWTLTKKTAVYGVNDESFPQACMPPDT